MTPEELTLRDAAAGVMIALDTKVLRPEHLAELTLALNLAWLDYEAKNCGTGHGGFKPGNTCHKARKTLAQKRSARRKARGKYKHQARRRGAKGARSANAAKHAAHSERHTAERRSLAQNIRSERNELRRLQSEEYARAPKGAANKNARAKLRRQHERERKDQAKQHALEVHGLQMKHSFEHARNAAGQRSEQAAARAAKAKPQEVAPKPAASAGKPKPEAKPKAPKKPKAKPDEASEGAAKPAKPKPDKPEKKPDSKPKPPKPAKPQKPAPPKHEPPKQEPPKHQSEPKSRAVESHDVLETIGRIAPTNGDLVPVHEVRRRIAEQLGPEAASHHVLDQIIRNLRSDRKIRLIAISDNRGMTEQQLADSIPGLNETLAYVSIRND